MFIGQFLHHCFRIIFINIGAYTDTDRMWFLPPACGNSPHSEEEERDVCRGGYDEEPKLQRLHTILTRGAKNDHA